MSPRTLSLSSGRRLARQHVRDLCRSLRYGVRPLPSVLETRHYLALIDGDTQLAADLRSRMRAA